MRDPDAAVSYAQAARSPAGRAAIRAAEALSGRRRLLARARGFEAQLARGEDVWAVMCDRFGIRIDVRGEADAIPASGPVVVVANHPFGILDGLVLGRLLSARRPGDVRILAHKVFHAAPALRDEVLPIDFDETRAARRTTLATRAAALAHLRAGGAIGVFPGGTVSTASRPWGRALDPTWRTFTARMIQRTGAAVVPVLFEGANGRAFQIASHLHYTARMALLVREFAARVDRPCAVTLGHPVAPAEMAPFAADPAGLMAMLRARTYALGPRPPAPGELGHEFEAHWRPRPSADVAPAVIRA
ncbi:MAG: lysophospholipid acyltransferase family protein [Paracoccaceae bacterium]